MVRRTPSKLGTELAAEGFSGGLGGGIVLIIKFTENLSGALRTEPTWKSYFSLSIAASAFELEAKTAEASIECVTNLRRFIKGLLIASVFDSRPHFVHK